MESKAHYALIGAMVIVFMVSLLSAVLWLSGNTLDKNFDEYVVTFNGPIRGVQEAAEVRFNGIKVGEVTQIRLNPDDPNKVLVRIEVFQETPVDTASYAQLEAQGLTGLNIIQLFSGGSGFPLLKNVEGVKAPYQIEGRESQLDSLLTGGGSIVESVQLALNSVLEATDEQAIEDFKSILGNVAAITQMYRDDPITSARIEETLANIDQASADVSIAALSVDVTARDSKALINNQVVPIIAQVSTTIDEINVTLSDAQNLLRTGKDVVDNSNVLISDVRAGTLRDLELAAANLNELVVALTRVADELERNPTSFIIGEKRELLELPQ